MTITAGLDIGSTYSKAVIVDERREILATAMMRTGFRLPEAAREIYRSALATVGLSDSDVAYVVSTGFGRQQVPFRDVHVTDVTAAARGAALRYPAARTVLDVGGQTMKASRIDETGRVKSFRMNDKCAAGTGAFLEKTARYMGYETEEIGPLVATSKAPVSISGVCAVFAESEVINHLSQGAAPADIMHGSMQSLVERCLQLLRRVRMEPEFVLLGGILRYPTMVKELSQHLDGVVHVPEGKLVQFGSAFGAAILGQRRLEILEEKGERPERATAVDVALRS